MAFIGRVSGKISSIAIDFVTRRPFLDTIVLYILLHIFMPNRDQAESLYNCSLTIHLIMSDAGRGNAKKGHPL